MSFFLYSNPVALSASLFATKENEKDYENSIATTLDNPPVAVVVCGMGGFDEDLKVAK